MISDFFKSGRTWNCLACIQFQLLFLIPGFGHFGSAYAETPNLVSNPGFETGQGDAQLSPWIRSHDLGGSREVVDAIQGKRSFRANAETDAPRTFWIRQNVEVDPDDPDSEYLFSANFRIRRGEGAFVLFYSVAGQAPVQIRRASLNGTKESKCWQKVIGKIPATGTSRINIYCHFANVKGFVFCDQVRLVPYRNLLEQSDFESDGAWDLIRNANAEMDFGYFGNRCLRLETTAQDPTAVVRQRLFKSGDPDFDKKIYTLSAHIRCEEVVPLNLRPSEFGGYGGVNVMIQCLGPEIDRRIIEMPFVWGTSEEFAEKKVSFLVPKGTTIIQIMPQIRSAAGIAFLDNVRLTAELPSLDNRPYCDWTTVGHHDFVEACEPGTFVAMSPGDDEQDISLRLDGIAESGLPTAGQKKLWFPAGDYPISSHIFVKRGMHFCLHRKAVLKRVQAPAIPFGFRSALIRTVGDNDTQVVSDVVIEGGNYASNGLPGIVANWRGNRWIIRNLQIPSWSNNENRGRGISWNGDNTFIYSNTVVGAGGLQGDFDPSSNDTWKLTEGQGQRGFGGVVMAGGRGAHLMSNYIHAGDDAIGLFTTTRQYQGKLENGNRNEVNSFDRDIEDVEVYHNILHSNGGRAFAAGIARPRDWRDREFNDLNDGRMKAKVQNIRVRDCTGECGGANQLLTLNCSPAHPERTDLPPEDFPSSVRDILIQRLDLKGRLDRPEDDEDIDLCPGCPKQNGIFLFTEDCGSLANLTLQQVYVEGFLATPNDEGTGDRPATGFGILIVKAGSRLYREGNTQLDLAPGPLANDNQNLIFEDCTITTEPPINGVQRSHNYRIEANGFNDQEIVDVEQMNVFSSLGKRIWECAGIGDRVFFDQNGNGIFDRGEVGIPGIRLRLIKVDDDPDDVFLNFVSDENGRYIFDQLPPGQYSVSVDQTNLPDGKQLSPFGLGPINKNSDIDPLTGRSPIKSLESCNVFRSIDVGLRNE